MFKGRPDHLWMAIDDTTDVKSYEGYFYFFYLAWVDDYLAIPVQQLRIAGGLDDANRRIDRTLPELTFLDSDVVAVEPIESARSQVRKDIHVVLGAGDPRDCQCSDNRG